MGIHVIVIKRKKLLTSSIFILVCFIIINLFSIFYSSKASPVVLLNNAHYVILATNTLGMQSYQADFSSYLLLPPGNTLRVQVFLNEQDTATLIQSGIDVSYQIIDNTSSADKINFWDYASDYGYDIAPNIGITGNGLSGKMELSEDGNYYEVTSIPITPYNDGSSELNPYQLAIITVTDSKTGKELARAENIVVPVSTEVLCSTCHGTIDTGRNILTAHDMNSNTHLIKDLDAGIRHKCLECHEDNALDAPGVPDLPSLSLAMHGFHADKMNQSSIKPECYSCHPGPVTQLYRGIMAKRGINCINSNCHGDMNAIASSLREGREAWLEQPNCNNCHANRFSTNPDSLYISSYLINQSNPEMNGFILCTSCHNSPHAEWESLNPKDNLLPIKLLGYSDFINRCSVCHEGTGAIHQFR